MPVQDQGGADLAGVSLVAAGGFHNLALHPGETLRGWGQNARGQLGASKTIVEEVGKVETLPRPTCVKTVTAAAAGAWHSLGITSDSSAAAWGENFLGQLGGTNDDAPRAVSVYEGGGGPLVTAIAVAAGDDHSLALKVDGTVWSWGGNFYGQLGIGTSGSGTDSNLAVQVLDAGGGYLEGVVAIAAGGLHSLALKADGTVWAWGDDLFGQLGTGSSGGLSPLPVMVDTALRFRAIGAGGNHSLGVAEDGTAHAWGYNGTGQLGDGSTIDRTTPVGVVTASGALELVAEVGGGSQHSLGRLGDGSVWAWGNNNHGPLGVDPGSVPLSLVAVAVTEPVPNAVWKRIAAGAFHSLAVRADAAGAGTVDGWGDNNSGQLGNECVDAWHYLPAPVERASPAGPVVLTGSSYVAGGGSKSTLAQDAPSHSLAGTTDNGASDPDARLSMLIGWGENGVGQLGLGAISPPVCVALPFPRTPDPVPGDQGNVLMGVKDLIINVGLSWDNAPGPERWKVYWYDTYAKKSDIPTPGAATNFTPQAIFVPAWVQTGVVPLPPTLRYYQLRAVSECYEDPGP